MSVLGSVGTSGRVCDSQMSFFTNNKTGNTPIAEDSRARDDELVRLDNRLRALEGGGGVAGRGVGSVSASTGQGPPGPPGEPGPPGPAGPPGADGLSAYEVAVNDGFTGSESDWLDSLVGDPGPVVPLGDLDDVTLTTPAEGDLLTFDSGSSEWVNRVRDDILLSELGGVDLTGAADGDALVFDGVEWLPVPMPEVNFDRCVAEVDAAGLVVLEQRGGAWLTALAVTPDGNGEFLVEHDLGSTDYVVLVTPIGAGTQAVVVSKGVDDVTVQCDDGASPAAFSLLMIAL